MGEIRGFPGLWQEIEYTDAFEGDPGVTFTVVHATSGWRVSYQGGGAKLPLNWEIL